MEFDDVVGKSVGDVDNGVGADLDLAGVTNSLVGDIIAPLSPIEPSPAAASVKSEEEEEEEEEQNLKRFSSPTKRSGGKVRPQVRAVPQQRELGVCFACLLCKIRFLSVFLYCTCC